MTNEDEIKEIVEDIEDAIEDVVELGEDLGLISDDEATTILTKVKMYKKYILITIPVAVALVIMIQSL